MKHQVVWFLVGLLVGLPCFAKEVAETLPSGLKVTADYRAAGKDAPSILILHGFLVTKEFPVIQALLADLSAKGYNVLAPSLALGISHRRSGLACDAVHPHTHEDDLAEVAFWVDWLARRSAAPIVLVGHSFGSTQLLDYLVRKPHPRVVGLVGMSLSYIGAQGEWLDVRELERAGEMMRHGDSSLAQYRLIYCHGNFTATAKAYLSYARLQRSEVLALANGTHLPRLAIMGGEDHRFGADWVKDMQRAGVQVQVVHGASHFFDGAFEFDLLDAVHRALASMSISQ